MKFLLSAAIFSIISSSTIAFAAEPLDLRPVIGSWEGESKCTIPKSSCKDEHVIYEIAADTDAPNHVHLDAYKVLGGKKESTGKLACTYRAGEILDCTANGLDKDHWEFRVYRERMIGSLVLGNERTLYRRIGLRKK
jgi:hypothetical protein